MTKIKRLFFSCTLLLCCSGLQTLAQVNLNQGLVAHYPFSGNAQDVSGNGNHPAFNNATLTSDRFGNPNSAYHFNGVDNYIQIPNAPSLNPANAISLCVYVKIEGFYDGTCHGNSILMKGNQDHLPGNYLLRYDDSRYTRNQNCFINKPDTLHQTLFGNGAGSDFFVQKDYWYCMVYTHDGSKARLYIDGVLQEETSDPGRTFSNGADLFLGRLNNAQYPYWFTGIMDDVRIYNRALNEQEIATLCPYEPPTFTVPDTVCVNEPVQIINGTAANSYYWNFCSANLISTPSTMNLGNPGNYLSQPVFMDYVFANNNYYAFVSSYDPGGLTRLDFGNSLLNTPTAHHLGNFGGIIPPGPAAEGIQLIYNEGRWYGLMVAGWVPAGSTPRVLKLDFGTDITNPSPVPTSWGNIGNMAQPIDLHVFKENNNWYGLTVNAENNTITRIDFTNSFNNTPTAVNLGNIGGLVYPTGIFAINDNGFWRVFVSNGGDNNQNGTLSSLTRLDFGSSLLNTPTGINLGNPGGMLKHPRDLTIMKSCGQIIGFAVNGNQNASDLVRLDFNNDLSGTPTINSLGNLDNWVFPHSISKLFRVKEDVYGFVTDARNNTITRLQFAGCASTTIPNSTDQIPKPITYTTPGTYHINLTIDEGLPTQDAVCKPIVVVPNPVVDLGKDTVICLGTSIVLDAGNAGATYVWQDGSTAQTFTVNAPGKYYVTVFSRHGCEGSDTILVAESNGGLADFHYRQDACNPYTLEFVSIGTAVQDPHWWLGDGTEVSGSLTQTHTYTGDGNYTVKFRARNGACLDSTEKVIPVNMVKANIVLTKDTVICKGTTAKLRSVPSLSFCWSPATYLDDPNSPNPVSSTPVDITYYFTAAVTGNNLITNGDFSNGNTGFTSAYQFAPSNTTEGQYFVGTNPPSWNGSLSNCVDHTTGNGRMMMVNGSPVPDVEVWRQTITVTPNTNYAFSTWIQALWPPNPAQLRFSINGKDVGDLITASLPTCTWMQFYTTWNAGNSTTATISIVNKNTAVQGNDFALDDISFAPVFLQRDSVIVKTESPLVQTNRDTTVCPKQPVPLKATGGVTYSWKPATGLTDPLSGQPIATPDASTRYIVTGTSANGCAANDTVEITIRPLPRISKSNDTLICLNTPAMLQVSGAPDYQYQWSPAVTLSDPSIPNPIATPAVDTRYYVTVLDQHKCENIDSIDVHVKQVPSFFATPDTATCKAKPVLLEARGGDDYRWTPGTYLDDPTSPHPSATPLEEIEYSVHISERYCQYDTLIRLTVAISPDPVVTAQKSNDIDCLNPSAQLQASGAATYTWQPAAYLDNPNGRSPIASVDTTTIFTVTGASRLGCTATQSITVYVTDKGKNLFVLPNAFSPNGDGKNDCFGIKKWGPVTVLEFAIYNRWGERVFNGSNTNRCWDGTYKGQRQAAGAFPYVIKAKTFCGEVQRTGLVMLIR